MKKTKFMVAHDIERVQFFIEKYELEGFEVVAPIHIVNEGEKMSFYITFQREEKISEKIDRNIDKMMNTNTYVCERPPRD